MIPLPLFDARKEAEKWWQPLTPGSWRVAAPRRPRWRAGAASSTPTPPTWPCCPGTSGKASTRQTAGTMTTPGSPIAELVVVSTSAITEITTEGQMLVLMNQREIGARRGLIVSGDAATGKTTSIKQLGRLHELRVRARFPAARDRIPVVDVTCPPKGSPRKLAMEFARFLGLPLRTRANVTDIADAVCQVLVDARTDLVLVDEIHNHGHGTPAGEDLSDHLKYFTGTYLELAS